MKIKDNLKIRNVAGENIVILQDQKVSDMTKLLSLNATSKYLWEQLKGKDFEVEDVKKTLLDHWDIDDTLASQDAQKWVDLLKANGAIQ
ncbi:MAG: PqqD family protein [Bacteroidales bacterium]